MFIRTLNRIKRARVPPGLGERALNTPHRTRIVIMGAATRRQRLRSNHDKGTEAAR